MDTRKLAVGVKIWMQSGDERQEVAVSKITKQYVEVAVTGPSSMVHYYVRFDKNGEQPDWDGTNIREWDFGTFGLTDAWSPLRLCGKNGEPYALQMKEKSLSTG